MDRANLTQVLALRAASWRREDIPEPARELVRQCVLDYFGVALAGAGDELVRLLIDEMNEAGGSPQASLIGHELRLPALSAALVNGAAAHALDYDDANMAMPGHPSVAILPGLLALAELRRSSGREVATAFVAGYETACRIGAAGRPARGCSASTPKRPRSRLALPGRRRPGSNRSSARCASRSTPVRRRRMGCWRRASRRAGFRAAPISLNASRASRSHTVRISCQKPPWPSPRAASTCSPTSSNTTLPAI